MRFGVLVMAACSAPPPAKPAPDAPLHVIALDDYRTHETCDGVTPHRIAIEVNDRPATTIVVPCQTQIHAPPQQIPSPAFVVARGHLRMHAMDLDTKLEATTELDAPVNPSMDLYLWANEDELEFQGLRPR